jgi:hypothetical protein
MRSGNSLIDQSSAAGDIVFTILTGHALDCGHFPPEEVAEKTVVEIE